MITRLALFRNTNLHDLLARAYGIRMYQIEGPEWMSSARFDIMAKLPEDAPAAQVQFSVFSFQCSAPAIARDN